MFAFLKESEFKRDILKQVKSKTIIDLAAQLDQVQIYFYALVSEYQNLQIELDSCKSQCDTSEESRCPERVNKPTSKCSSCEETDSLKQSAATYLLECKESKNWKYMDEALKLLIPDVFVTTNNKDKDNPSQIIKSKSKKSSKHKNDLNIHIDHNTRKLITSEKDNANDSKSPSLLSVRNNCKKQTSEHENRKKKKLNDSVNEWLERNDTDNKDCVNSKAPADNEHRNSAINNSDQTSKPKFETDSKNETENKDMFLIKNNNVNSQLSPAEVDKCKDRESNEGIRAENRFSSNQTLLNPNSTEVSESDISAIEGTPDGRRSPILGIKKPKHTTESGPKDCSTPNLKVVALSRTQSKTGTSKKSNKCTGAKKLRQSYLTTQKVKTAKFIDLTGDMDHSLVNESSTTKVEDNMLLDEEQIQPTPAADVTRKELNSFRWPKISPPKLSLKKEKASPAKATSVPRVIENQATSLSKKKFNDTPTQVAGYHDIEARNRDSPSKDKSVSTPNKFENHMHTNNVKVKQEHEDRTLRSHYKLENLKNTKEVNNGFKSPAKVGRPETKLELKEDSELSLDATRVEFSSPSKGNTITQVPPEILEAFKKSSSAKTPRKVLAIVNSQIEDVEMDESMSLLQAAGRQRENIHPALKMNKDTTMEVEEPGFVYREGPVRKKADKLKLPGWSCEQCEQWYGARDMCEAERRRLMDACSRHRARHDPARPRTPPHYWAVDWTVPDDADELNRRNNAT